MRLGHAEPAPGQRAGQGALRQAAGNRPGRGGTCERGERRGAEIAAGHRRLLPRAAIGAAAVGADVATSPTPEIEGHEHAGGVDSRPQDEEADERQGETSEKWIHDRLGHL